MPRKRILSSIIALRGFTSENGVSHYLCVMRKSCTSIWKSEEKICKKELAKLLVLHGKPKPWFVCPHGWKRPLKRTIKDNFEECPACHPQQVHEDTEDEDDDDEDGDDDDDDNGDHFSLDNYPNCKKKANDLPFRLDVVLHKIIMDENSGIEETELSAGIEENLELGSEGNKGDNLAVITNVPSSLGHVDIVPTGTENLASLRNLTVGPFVPFSMEHVIVPAGAGHLGLMAHFTSGGNKEIVGICATMPCPQVLPIGTCAPINSAIRCVGSGEVIKRVLIPQLSSDARKSCLACGIDYAKSKYLRRHLKNNKACKIPK